MCIDGDNDLAEVDQDKQDELFALSKKAEQGDAQAQFDLACYYFPVKRTLWEPEEEDQDDFETEEPEAQESDPQEPMVLWSEFAPWNCGSGRGYAAEWAEEEEDRAEQFKLEQAFVANAEKAMFWYRLAAEQGHVEAQYAMGVGYENGQGVPQDLADAVMWYRLAAAQGYELAQIQQRYLEENVLPLGAAEEGDANAQFLVGVYYDNKEEPVLATKWYHLAAVQGHEEAQSALKEIDGRLGFSIVAAEQGDPEAQYNLGVAYYDGQDGVPEDRAKAYAWVSVAADRGNQVAADRRLIMLEEITSEETAEGERLSREYAKKCVK